MKELSEKKYRTLCMKRLITVMLISIAVISIQILWAYDALLDEYPKGYGFDVAKMKQLGRDRSS